MRIIDDLIDLFVENYLTKYKYNFKYDRQKLKDLYENYLPLIEKCYKDAHYWHGTGRYHYQHLGQTKYHSSFSDNTFDVLESIISNNGLTCQYDFWTNINSISLTKNRIYARAYSEFHQYENNNLKYVFGTTRFWFYVLGLKQVFTNRVIHNLKRIKGMSADATFKDKFYQWAKYVRKDPTKPEITMFTFYKLHSDIEGNYGILFGIKKQFVNEHNYNSTIERFETRSLTPLTFEMMTHIEVPLDNIDETKSLLEKNNISISVLPIELTEIYCNTMDYKMFS